MGKASRRQRGAGEPRTKVAPAPYVARPFEGLANEPEWVAIREILPAATATIRLRDSVGDGPREVTVATVLPMAWPGMHRADGAVLVGTQSGASSGDASRDLAAAILATRALEPGNPLPQPPVVTAETPRLQDIVEGDFEVTVQDGFDFWVGEGELDDAARESLERANESIVPMTRLAALPSAYHVNFGDRSFIRVILGDDEDPATDALARLHASGEDSLGEGTRLLGAFRACGVLVPVLEVDAAVEPAAHESALAAWGERYAAALASATPLTPEERRARNGLLSRQVTLR